MDRSGTLNVDELTAATDRLAAVAKAFLSGESVSSDLAKAAYCEVFRAMNAAEWLPERALDYGRRVTAVQCRALGRSVRIEDRRQWLAHKIVSSACSGFSRPSPGKACTGSALCSRTHFRSTLGLSPKSRAA
jgi:hypothetical protein